MFGETAAFTIILRKGARDIVLIDALKKHAIVEVHDVAHLFPFVTPADIYAGSYNDLKDVYIKFRIILFPTVEFY